MIKPQLFPKWSRLYTYKPEIGITIDEYTLPRINWDKVTSYDIVKFVPSKRIENLLVTSYHHRNNIGEYWQ